MYTHQSHNPAPQTNVLLSPSQRSIASSSTTRVYSAQQLGPQLSPRMAANANPYLFSPKNQPLYNNNNNNINVPHGHYFPSVPQLNRVSSSPLKPNTNNAIISPYSQVIVRQDIARQSSNRSGSRHKSPSVKRPSILNKNASKNRLQTQMSDCDMVQSQNGQPNLAQTTILPNLAPQFLSTTPLIRVQQQVMVSNEVAASSKSQTPQVQKMQATPIIATKQQSKSQCHHDQKEAKYKDQANKLYCFECTIKAVHGGNVSLVYIEGDTLSSSGTLLQKLRLEISELNLRLNNHINRIPEDTKALEVSCSDMKQAVKQRYASLHSQIQTYEMSDISKIDDFHKSILQSREKHLKEFTDALGKLKEIKINIDHLVAQKNPDSKKSLHQEEKRLHELVFGVVKWENQKIHFPEVRNRDWQNHFKYEDVRLIDFPAPAPSGKPKTINQFSFDARYFKDGILVQPPQVSQNPPEENSRTSIVEEHGQEQLQRAQDSNVGTSIQETIHNIKSIMSSVRNFEIVTSETILQTQPLRSSGESQQSTPQSQ